MWYSSTLSCFVAYMIINDVAPDELAIRQRDCYPIWVSKSNSAARVLVDKGGNTSKAVPPLSPSSRQRQRDVIPDIIIPPGATLKHYARLNYSNSCDVYSTTKPR